jgi:exodeoxyribonuclease III
VNYLDRLLRAVLISAALWPNAGCSLRQSHRGPESDPRSVVDVYLLAGQSNMEGIGRAGHLPGAATPHAFLFHTTAVGAPENAERWLPLGPAGWCHSPTGGFGVEVGLGAALAHGHAERPIYLIKHAVGGTSIYGDWDPSSGPQFLWFKETVERALGKLTDQGRHPVIRGIFWQQGEADAKDPQNAQIYSRLLGNFIVRTRAMLREYAPEGRPDRIRFVVGQVIPDATPGSNAHTSYPFRDDVRAAQLAVARNLRNVVTVPTNASFETHASDGDGYRDKDNVHFNEAGLTKLAGAMAAAYFAEDAEAGARASLLPQHADATAFQPRSSLRVLNYNTYYVFAKGQQVADGSAWIRSQTPDIVALQELTSITHERLTKLATGWGHAHSALLKTSGFSVGLTSSMPIEVIARVTEGMHHGYLHARIAGIHVFVVHLSPFQWSKRQMETEALLTRIQPHLDAGADVMVMGDFNANSPDDHALLQAQPERLRKARESDAAQEHVKNLRNDQFDFTVMQRFMDAGLEDTALPYLEQSRFERWTLPTGIWSEAKDAPPIGGARIDFILASPRLASHAISGFVTRQGVVNQTSDHYPVIVDFRVPQLD